MTIVIPLKFYTTGSQTARPSRQSVQAGQYQSEKHPVLWSPIERDPEVGDAGRREGRAGLGVMLAGSDEAEGSEPVAVTGDRLPSWAAI